MESKIYKNKFLTMLVLMIALSLGMVKNVGGQTNPSPQEKTVVIKYETAGTYNVTIPSGVTTKVEGWGGGGAGGSSTTNGRAAGGGGGGAYATTSAIAPGNYTLTVANGGNGALGATNRDGENTTFGDVLRAVGGKGVANNTTARGAGGQATDCTPTANAQPGGNGSNGTGTGGGDDSGGGGGGAGSTQPGSNANGTNGGNGGSLHGGKGGNGLTSNDNGNAGALYAAGGGGGKKANTGYGGNRNGGNGTRGRAEITITLPTPTIVASAVAICEGETITLSATTTGTPNGNPNSGQKWEFITWNKATGEWNGMGVYTNDPLALTKIDQSGKYKVRAHYTIVANDNQPIWGYVDSDNSVEVVIYPKPKITNTNLTQTVCNRSTATITLTSSSLYGDITSLDNVIYTWVNNNPNIISLNNGEGTTLLSFTVTNPGTTEVSATITVTPSRTESGITCTGDPVVFTITVPGIPSIALTNPEPFCAGKTINELITPVVTWNGPAGTTGWRWENYKEGDPDFSGDTPLGVDHNNAPIYYYAKSTCGDVAESSTITLTIHGNQTISTQPVMQAACTGSALSDFIKTNAVIDWGGGATGTAGWSRSNQEIEEVALTETFSSSTTLYYYAKSSCRTVFSAPASITIDPLTVAGTVSAAQTICSGSTPVALTLSGNTGNVVKWQWSTDGFVSDIHDILNTSTTLTPTEINNTATRSYRAVVKSGACDEAYTEAVLITVNPIPDVTVALNGNNEVCSGDQISFAVTPVNGANSLAYTLYANETELESGTLAPTEGQEPPYTVTARPTVTEETVYTIKFTEVKNTVTGCVNINPTQYGGSITVNPIPAAPSITMNPVNGIICETGTVTLTATAVADATYTWYLGTTEIEDETGNTLTVDAAGSYTVTVTLNGCTSAVSGAVAVIVNDIPETPEITMNPVNGIICETGTVTLTATAVADATYTWYLGTTEIEDKTGNTLTVDEAGAGSYTVTVTLNDCTSAVSEPADVIVNPLPNVSVVLSGDDNEVCSGDLITFTVTAINGADSLAYELSDGTSTIEGVLIPTSGQSSPYTVTARPTVTKRTVYTIKFTEVKNTVTGCINKAPTQYEGSITVNPIPDVEVDLNGSNVVCSGDQISFTVTAINGADSLAYELSDGTSTIEGVLIPTSGQSSPYTVTARPIVTVPTVYTIKFTEVKNTVTGCINKAPTQYEGSITVNPIPDVTVALNGSNKVCSGELVSFEVTPVNGADYVAYTLYASEEVLESGTLEPTEGQEAPYTVTARPIVTERTVYTIEFTEVKNTVTGCINTAPTQYEGSITVNPIPDVEVELNSSNVVCSGDQISFTVTAINGADSLAYTLKANGTELESGTLEPTEGQESPYTVTARPTVTVPTEYTIVFTEVKNTVTGCINTAPTQYEGSITVNPIPDVEVELNSSNVVCSGDQISFTVTAINGADSLAYTLKANGTELESGTLEPTEGQESPYTVTARPTVTVPTEYTIVFTEVKNTVTGCINTAPTQYEGSITVNPIPDVEVELNSSNVVCSGDQISFTVTAINGADSLAYTLKANGTELESGTLEPTEGQEPPYTVTARPIVTVPTEYTIVFTEVKNTVTGCINTEPTQYEGSITVNPIPDVTVALNGNNEVCSGDQISFTVTAINGADSLAYTLKANGTELESGTLEPTEGQESPYTVTARPTVTVPTEYTIVFTEVKNTVTGCVNAEPTQYTERITVNPIPDVEVELNSNNVVCSGDLITFTVTAINGADSLAYELSDGTNTIEGVLIPISGQSSPYTVTARPTVTVPTEYTIVFTEVKNTVTGCINAEPTQYTERITVNPIPDVTVALNGNNEVCSGDQISFTVTAINGADSLAYELSDGTNTIEGVLIPTSGQSSPYTVTARPIVTVPTEYTIAITEVKNTVTGCINAEPTQYEGSITVNPIPDVTVALNGNNEVCSGDQISFTVTAINGADSLAYTLKANGTELESGTLEPTEGQESPYTVTARPTVTVPTEYTIVFTEVKNTVTGCINAEPTQYTERITVNPIPDVTVALNGNNEVCSGDLITFTVTAINGADSLAYELSDGTSTIEGALIPTSGQSSPYTVTARPTVTVPTEYTIVFTEVKNTVTGCINTAPTQYEGSITVNPIPDVEVELNSSNVVCSGDQISFTVTAINGADSLAYTLKANGTELESGTLEPTEGQESPYTVTARPTVTERTVYTIEFTEVKNTVTGCVNINPTQYGGSITVNPIPEVSVVIKDEDGNVIDETTSLCSGQEVTFTFDSETGANYIAYTLNGVSGELTLPSGETLPYDLSVTLPEADDYTIAITEVKNAAGCVNETPDYEETFTVNPIPDVTVALNGSNKVCSGELVSFEVTPVNGANSLAYTLYANGTELESGILVPTEGQEPPYTVTARPIVTVPTVYTIKFTEVKNTVTGCINAEPTQYEGSITVNPIPAAPSITMAPEGGLICGEGSVTLTATAVADATYTWYLGTTEIEDKTGNTLTVDAVGSYTVTVTLNNCTSAVSEPADVIVNDIPGTPEITMNPENGIICGTGTVTLTATEVADATYTWYLNGSVIDGAANVLAVDAAGSYTVAVTLNGCTSAVSGAVAVIVNDIPGTPVITMDPATGIIYETGTITLTATGVTNGTYTWYWGNDVVAGETTNILVVDQDHPGIYKVSVTVDGCSSEKSESVEVILEIPDVTVCINGTTTLTVSEGCMIESNTGAINAATVDQINATGFSTGDKEWTLGPAAGEHTNRLCGQLLGDGDESTALRLTGFNFGTLLPNVPENEIEITGISISFERWRNTEIATVETIQDHSIGLLLNGAKLGNPDVSGRGTNWPGTYATKTYGGATTTWGATLTKEVITNSTFGLYFVAEAKAATLCARIAVRNFTMTVYYKTGGHWYTAESGGELVYTGNEVIFDADGGSFQSEWTSTATAGAKSLYLKCANSESRMKMSVLVNDIPETPEITMEPEDGLVCGEGSVALTTSEVAGATYTWYLDGSVIDGAATNVLEVDETGSYTVTVTLNDCTSEVSGPAEVIVNPLPEGTIAGEATTCAGTEEEYSLDTESTNLTYAWTVTGEGNNIDDAASAAPTVTWSISGTLSVTFTDENGCEGEATLDVTVNPLPEGTIAGAVTTCAGTEEEYSLDTESTNLTYAWTVTGEGNSIDDAASAAPTVTWSISGTLSVTFTDENGCEGEATLDVTVNPLPEGTIAGEATTCAGTEEEYSLETESTNLTYAWTVTGEGNNIDDAASAAPTVTWSISGTLSVTFTDENGCEGEATLDVTVNPLPEGTIAGAVTTCAGTEEEYSLDTESTNLTYAWTVTGEGNSIDDAASAAPTVTWSISGTLSVTFTDENGCEGEATLDVTVNPLPEGTIAGEATTCAGTEEEYSLETESTNLTYAWTVTGEGNSIDDAASAAPTVTWSISGTLSVTFTDENGCEGEATLDVTVNPLPEGTIAGEATTCAGTEEEYSLETESTNLTYAWTVTGEGNSIDDAASAAPTVTWSISGTLSVTFTDENGCEGEATLDVTVNPLPEGTIAGEATTCAGTEEEYSLETESTNLTYAWTVTGEGNSIDDAASAAPTVTWSISGTLSVTFTDENGCEGEATLDVTVNPLPEGTIAGAVTTCAGTEEEYSLDTESTNLTYAWTITGEGNNIDDATSAAPTVTWSISGILSVTFTDENGCEGEATLDVTVNPLPEGTIAGAVTTCAGTEEEYSLDTESTNLTYAWTITGEGNNIDDATSAAPTVTWSISGILSVTFTDENGCEGEATLDVTVNPLPEGTIAGAVTTCAGTEEEYSLDTESTNLTYAWTVTGEGNSIDDAASAAPTVTWSISGTLSVTFTDENGCEGEATLDVTVNPLPEGTIAGAVTTCAGTEEEYSLDTESTNLTYAWTVTGEGNSIDDAASAAPTVTWSISGTLSVTFTDENGCEGEATLDVTVNPLPEGTIAGEATTCAGTEEEYSLETESTNLTYAWTVTGEGNSIDDAASAAPTVTWSISGTLSVTFTDENGCEGEATLDVTVNPLPEGTIAGEATTCAGTEEEYSLETESTNLTYAWTVTGEGNSIDDAASAAPTVTWSISGTLSVTFTDENGCEGEATLDVTVNPLPEGTIAGAVTTCAGTEEEYSLDTESTNLTYAWTITGEGNNIDDATSAAPTVTWSISGTLSVTFTDENGCEGEATLDVTVNPLPETPEITMNPVNGIICETGAVTLTATAVADATYTWYLGTTEIEGETGNTLTVDEAGAGSYTVTVTLNDCTSEVSEPADVIVNDIPATPSITMNPATGIIYGTGTVTLTATEVVNGIYTWYLGDNVVAGETTNILVVDQDHSGIYKVSVAVDGCSSEKSESVEVILEMSVCIDGTMTLTAPDGCVAENTTGAISPTAVAQTASTDFSRGDKAWTLGAAAGEHNIQLCESLSGGEESNALQLTGFNFDVLNNLSSDEVEITGISISFERKRNTGLLTVGTIQDHSIGLLLNGDKLGNPNTSGRGTNWPGTYATKTYGDATTTWGATLTKEVITNSAFGLYFVAEAKASGVGLVCAESAVRNFTMTVYYKTGGQWYTAESGGELVYTGNEVIFDADGGSTQSAWTSTATPGVKSLYLQCGDERTEMSVNVIDNQSVEWEATELLFADGDPEKINLTYEGFTPWSFTYSVNGGTDILVEDIEETTYSIDLSGYEIGDYVFELTNLNEGMCVTLPDPIALTIVDEVLPTDIEILNCPDRGILYVNNTYQMEAQISPHNVSNKTILWRSSNPNVAVVDANGLVTCRNVFGLTYIIAATADGSFADTCSIMVIIPPTSIVLNKSELTMSVSTTERLSATVFPINATHKEVTWESSDETIATVDQNGYVTAIALGNVTITATAVYGDNLYAECAVSVVESEIPATGIAITPKTLIIDEGETADLTVTLKPINATSSVTWTSNNPAVATVDSNGTVTAILGGKATITAQTSTGYKATCTVTVTVPIDEIIVTPDECTLPFRTAKVLKATVYPTNATNKTITWSSSNTALATVSATGIVTAKSTNGVVEIYATNVASGKKGICVVTIGTGDPAVPIMSITEENELSNIELFPNPVTSVLTVKFNGNAVQDLEIYNLQGQRISSQSVKGKDQVELNVESLPTGIYFIRADQQTLKFVKR